MIASWIEEIPKYNNPTAVLLTETAEINILNYESCCVLY